MISGLNWQLRMFNLRHRRFCHHFLFMFQQPYFSGGAISPAVISHFLAPPRPPSCTLYHPVARDQDRDAVFLHRLTHCTSCFRVPRQLGQLLITQRVPNASINKCVPDCVEKTTYKNIRISKFQAQCCSNPIQQWVKIKFCPIN